VAKHRLAVNNRAKVRVPRQLLQQVLEQTVRRFGPSVATETSLALVSPTAIANLNRVYRGKAGSTDVLSFSFYRGNEKSPLRPMVLGEVVVAPAVAAQRSKRFGHPISAEIGLLFLHGLLHVLGLDHEQGGRAKDAMRKAEAAVVRSIPQLSNVHSGHGVLIRELVTP